MRRLARSLVLSRDFFSLDASADGCAWLGDGWLWCAQILGVVFGLVWFGSVWRTPSVFSGLVGDWNMWMFYMSRVGLPCVSLPSPGVFFSHGLSVLFCSAAAKMGAGMIPWDSFSFPFSFSLHLRVPGAECTVLLQW